MIMIDLHNTYHLYSSVNITDAELKKKRQRALELKQFLLDNKVKLLSLLTSYSQVIRGHSRWSHE